MHTSNLAHVGSIAISSIIAFATLSTAHNNKTETFTFSRNDVACGGVAIKYFSGAKGAVYVFKSDDSIESNKDQFHCGGQVFTRPTDPSAAAIWDIGYVEPTGGDPRLRIPAVYESTGQIYGCTERAEDFESPSQGWLNCIFLDNDN